MQGAPTTAAQVATIAKLTRSGTQQKKIAATLGLCPPTIAKAQRLLGLRQRVPDREPLPEETKKQIISMLRDNVPRLRIARELGVSLDKLHSIAKRLHFRRQRGSVGCAYKLTPAEITAIRKALTRSEESICKKFHVSRWWLRKFRLGDFSRRKR